MTSPDRPEPHQLKLQTQKPTVSTLHQSPEHGRRDLNPQRWIWNPLLCQLSYTRRPLLLARLFVQGVATKLRTILHQLKPLRAASLFDYSIVSCTRFSALQPHVFPHLNTSAAKAQSCLSAFTDRQPLALQITGESWLQRQNRQSCHLRESRIGFRQPEQSACQVQLQPSRCRQAYTCRLHPGASWFR